ncbi:MAG: 5-formyltetrahydrofolate cyclo-ligase [Nitrosomonas sp.]|nr:5-formyltetrahydrofolate cyclo-ligase [Nitrosomonas sp.]MDP1950104.1 5-formyltetrahydrofolate cyclo-ligase [Nitrosomonas sp.]
MDDWKKLRKQQRTHLIARRAAVTEKDFHHWGEAITASLQQGFPVLQKSSIGLYWPIQGEYDPRPAMNCFLQCGATLALPTVINKHSPLYFSQWWPDAPLKKGAFNIPVPDNTAPVAIDAVIMPMVGFDRQGYRLGYGSGLFDRTLAAMNPQPLVIGIAFELLYLDSVNPQPHDIPMEFIVTEAGIYQSTKKGLVLISTAECALKNAAR